jgi:hypothetical protein
MTSEHHGELNPSLDLNKLIHSLSLSWEKLYSYLKLERKVLNKKLTSLSDAKKPDTESINRLRNDIKLVEENKAVALVNLSRFQVMISILPKE